MRKVFLLGLAGVSLLLVQSMAFGQSLSEIQQAIKIKEARWISGETSLTRLSPEEQQKRVSLILPVLTEKKPLRSLEAAPVFELPTGLDWRNNGGNYVTPIRDQGLCGSCWAFSTTAALESLTLISSHSPGTDLDLAEQVLVSCGAAGNCTGGRYDLASDFIENTGLPGESCYPYAATDGSCSSACADWQFSTYRISSWQYVATTRPTVNDIKSALYTYGPLPTSMAVYSDFFGYQRGVYSFVSGGFAGYHGVLIIGYDDTEQCFIVKNSWGTEWGESGFFRIAYSELSSPVGFGGWTIAYMGAVPPGCSYTVGKPSPNPFSASGGNGSVSVNTGNGCPWTGSSNSTWITITSGASGTGNGSVSFSVSSNLGTSRTGTLTVAGQTLTISQDGISCSYSIIPTQQSFGVDGGNGSVGVTAGSGCAWTAQVDSGGAGWLTITAGGSGSGSGTVVYSVAANSSVSARTGTLTIAGKTFSVNQEGISSCSFKIFPISNSFVSSGGTGSVSVNAGSGCSWRAASNASWITVTSGGSGSGNGTVNYSVAANTGGSPRTGTLTIAGQTFTVNQDGSSCSYTIGPTSGSFMASGGAGSVSVIGDLGCSWTAVSNSSWVTITSGAGGSGYGVVNYSVAAYSGSYRTGTLTVAGKTFTIYQWGAGCSYTISPTSNSFSTSGGAGSVSVNAGSGCSWTAASNASWITVTSGGSGSGNGAVNYSVAANTVGSPRTGTLTIAEQTFTVNQGGGGCSFSISPTSNSFSTSGGAGSVSVNAGSGCSWTAASNASWITVTSGGSGSGNGTVNYSVAANTGGSPRTGTLTIAGQTFTVNQDGSSCSYTIGPTSGSFMASGGAGSVSVIGDLGCSWTAVSNSSWVTITSGAGGSGYGVVNYSVAAYSGSYRTGTLTVAGKTFTIYQWGPGY